MSRYDLYRDRYDGRNGVGQALIFGIFTRAMVEKGDGWHDWQIPTSQATERNTKASATEKPHWSTRIRAASSHASSIASRTSGPDVP